MTDLFALPRRAGGALALAAALALAGAPATLQAHAGEDHGAPPPTAGAPLLPRAASATDEFELVAVLEPQRLVVWLDRQATNEPVAGATVAIEGAFAGMAAETAPGVYALALAAAPAPGHHALTLTIEAGATADLLTATLDVPAPPADAVAVDGVGAAPVVTLAATLAGLAAAGAAVWAGLARRRSRRAGARG